MTAMSAASVSVVAMMATSPRTRVNIGLVVMTLGLPIPLICGLPEIPVHGVLQPHQLY